MLNLIYKIIAYNLYRKINLPKSLPMILTLSVNDWCNSRCKTCSIWKNSQTEMMSDKLTPDEYGKIMDNFDMTLWITITGGEPFLREDLPEIIKVVYEKTRPRFISIATNGSITKRIVASVNKILEMCPDLKLIINLSIDGIGSQHDEIRGVKGSYTMAMKTFKELKRIKSSHLFVGFNTVISTFNVKNFQKMFEHLQQLRPDSYTCEVAENRAKLYNLDLQITPDVESSRRVLKYLISALSKQKKEDAVEIVRKLRIEFYNYLISNEKIENFEGISSGYIMSNGEVWLSYSKKFVAGNLRDVNYDFGKLWFNKKSDQLRKIMNNNYYTTTVNSFYSSFICNPRNVLKMILS